MRSHSHFQPQAFRSQWFAGAAAAVFLGACAHPGGSAVAPSPAVSADDQCVAAAAWVVPGRGRVSVPDLMAGLDSHRVVLLGEYHDDVMHHAWQLGVISALAGRRAELVIGLEMLPRSAQPALDRWIAGEIGEAEFVSDSQWWQYWKFDPELYLPILRYARLHQIPVYGLNVERSLVDAVRSKGWDNVPVAERAGITDPAPPVTDYLDMLAMSYSMHGSGAGHGRPADLQQIKTDPGFQRFVQGQQLWDRGIAQSLVAVGARHPNATIVGLMGSGHLMDRQGVPHQLADLGVADAAVLLPWDEAYDCAMLTANFADAVFGVRSLASAPEPEGPKLGVQIEPAGERVRVAKVVAGSVAEGAGVKDNDLLLNLAGREMHSVEDVITTVRAMLPGTWLPVTVQRGEDQMDLVAKFPLGVDSVAPGAAAPVPNTAP